MTGRFERSDFCSGMAALEAKLATRCNCKQKGRKLTPPAPYFAFALIRRTGCRPARGCRSWLRCRCWAVAAIYLFSEIASPFRRTSLAGRALPKDDPTLGEIVGRHFEMHSVAHDRADAKFTHFAGCISNNLVLVIEPDGEASIGKNFLDEAFYRQQFFFCQRFEFRDACQPFRLLRFQRLRCG